MILRTTNELSEILLVTISLSCNKLRENKSYRVLKVSMSDIIGIYAAAEKVKMIIFELIIRKDRRISHRRQQ